MDTEREVSLTYDAWQRMSAATIDYEKRRRGSVSSESPRPDHVDVTVQVTGGPLTVTLTSTMPTSVTSIPAPVTKVVYKGNYVARNYNEQGNDKWYTTGESCYVMDVNNQGLWTKRTYIGACVGDIGGLGIVGVCASADPQKLAIVSSAPELTIAGIDYWPAAVLMWDQNTGQHTDANVYDDEVLVFDPDNLGFNYGDEIWGKLSGPVMSPYGGSSLGCVGPGTIVTSFEVIKTGASGSIVKIVRIVDSPVDDGFWFYYPGIIQQEDVPPETPWLDEVADRTINVVTSESDDPFDKPINCWVKFWNSYPDVVSIDGNGACEPVYQGKAYDPTGTGDYELPLFAATSYSALRAVACSGSPLAIVGQLGT